MAHKSNRLQCLGLYLLDNKVTRLKNWTEENGSILGSSYQENELGGFTLCHTNTHTTNYTYIFETSLK